MLQFVFSPEVQARIASGAYEVVRNKATGQLIGLVRDKATGKFVAHAALAVVRSTPLAPLIPLAELVMGGMQIINTNLGFQETNSRIDAGFQETNTRIGLVDDHLQSLNLITGAQIIQNHLGFQGTYRRMDEGFQKTYKEFEVIQAALRSLQHLLGAIASDYSRNWCRRGGWCSTISSEPASDFETKRRCKAAKA